MYGPYYGNGKVSVLLVLSLFMSFFLVGLVWLVFWRGWGPGVEIDLAD